MDDFIRRSEALQFVFDACTECMTSCEEFDGIYADCDQCMLENVKLKLRDTDSSDVAPVVHGKWKEENPDYLDGDSVYICSVCDETWNLEAGTPKENNMNYCPNCGAKMDL